MDFELISVWSIFSICCSSRRKFERYEKIIQQEKDKNTSLKFELNITIKMLIDSYKIQLIQQQEVLKRYLIAYDYAEKQYKKVKELKLAKNFKSLQSYAFVERSIDSVEEDWKENVKIAFENLDKQMIMFEELEQKIKMFEAKIY